MRWTAAVLLLAGCDPVSPVGSITCTGSGSDVFSGTYLCPADLQCAPAPDYCGKPDPNVSICVPIEETKPCTTADNVGGVCLTTNGNRTCTACTADIAWCQLPGWNKMTVPSGYTFGSLWVATTTDAYLGVSPVGADAIGVLHWDGRQWAPMPAQPGVGANTKVVSIWGTGPSDIYVAYGATVSHFDGAMWHDSAGPFPMTSAAGTNGKLFATGTAGRLSYFDGAWHTSSVGTGSPVAPTYQNVWSGDGTHAYAVASIDDTTVTGAYAYFNGTSWTAMGWPKALYGVWGASTVYGVGAATGSMLTIVDLTPSGATADPGANGVTLLASLHGVWGAGPSDAYACGGAGSLYHFDGTAWMVKAPLQPNEDLIQVAGTAPDNVFAISANHVWRYAGM